MYLQLRRWLSSPRAGHWVFGLSVALACVSLDTGLGADDHIHQLVMRGSHRLPGFADDGWDLFRFAGDPESNRKHMLDGVFPWWANPQASLAFWRPLSVLTHRLDHHLWPETPALMHAHSIAYFALLLWGARVLYRRLEPWPWVAVLAFAIFALDDARAPPLTWTANRHAVISAALAVWMLVAHDRWVREGWLPGSLLAALALIAGLLAGESTVAVGGYLFAHACFLDTGSWRLRVLRLLPYAAIVAVWQVGYVWLEYGAHGSGVYVNPVHRPWDFLEMAVQRFPVLMLGQLGLPWSDGWAAYDLIWAPAKLLVMGLALLVLLGLGWILVPLWRHEPRVRFWIVGSLLAAVPACATFPADRMLTLVAVGASGTLAELFAAVVRRREPRGRSDAATPDAAGFPPSNHPARTQPPQGAVERDKPQSPSPPPDRPTGTAATAGPDQPSSASETRTAGLLAFFGSPLRGRMAVWATHGIVLVHLVAAPLLFPMRARGIIHVRESLQRAERSVPDPRPDIQRTLVYVNPPSDPFACYVPIMRAVDEEGAPPEPQRWLATGATRVTLERLDTTTLRVTQEGGFLPSAAERMLRSPRTEPFRVGEVIHVPPMHVHIEEVTEDGRPAVIRARFDRPLEAPSLVWLRWEEDGFVPFAPPPIGERKVLPAVDMMRVIAGD